MTGVLLPVIDDMVQCRPLYFSSSAFPSSFDTILAPPAGLSRDKIQRGIGYLKLAENTGAGFGAAAATHPDAGAGRKLFPL
jgi:hypothetical protein